MITTENEQKKEYFKRKIQEEDIKAIKHTFINGEVIDGKRVYPTLTELVNRYNNDHKDNPISYKWIATYSSNEKWSKQKTLILNRTKEQKSEQELRELLSVSSTLEATVLDNVNKTHKLISLYLEKYRDYFGDDYDSEYKDLDTEDLPDINTKDLIGIVSATEKLLSIQRKVLGEEDFATNIYQEIKALEKEATDTKEDVLKELKQQISELEKEKRKINAIRNNKPV